MGFYGDLRENKNSWSFFFEILLWFKKGEGFLEVLFEIYGSIVMLNLTQILELSPSSLLGQIIYSFEA